MQYFPKVTLFFLVKGQTKNACDRLFNLVKLDYHKADAYTYDQLYDRINANEFITAHKMKTEDMFDFIQWQDRFYRALAGGDSVECTHFLSKG